MRGNRGVGDGARHGSGSIPAYAGEPAVGRSPPSDHAVYPRVCGGTLRWVWSHYRTWGLSPRMRGNLAALTPARPAPRSIPAYAGEPMLNHPPRGRSRSIPAYAGEPLEAIYGDV